MITDYFGNELVRGDLIMVSFDNALGFCVFAGEGSKSNPNFVYVSKQHADHAIAGNKVYNSYINSGFSARIIKILPEFVDKERLEYAQTIINYLKTH